MKKNLFILAVGGVLFTLASCSNDETVAENTTVNQPREIAFAPVAQNATRAFTYGINDGTSLDDEQPIYVSAYSIPTTGTAKEYFSNATFDKDGSNVYWVASPKQYWPLTPVTMNFLGVTGVPSANVSSFTSAGATITWTHNGSLTEATTMYDLMYAVGQGAVTQSGNVLTYGNNVAMPFKHALAQIVFNTAVGNTNYAANIHIDKIVLNSMVTAATYTLTNSTPTTTAAQSASGTWAVTTNADTDVPGSNAFASTNMTTTPQANGKVIVPCKDDATTFNSFSGFTVYFTMNGSQYTYAYTPTDAEKVLTQGKKYVYNITLSLTEIRIAPSVYQWNDTDFDGDVDSDDSAPAAVVVPIPAVAAP